MSDKKRPLPHELHRQANGDRDEYVRLMLLHGWIVKKTGNEPDKPLPCGWSPFKK